MGGRVSLTTILRWILLVGVLWFFLAAGLVALQSEFPENLMLQAILPRVIDWGAALARFAAPIIQLLFIIIILVAAAERFGLTGEKREWPGLAALSTSNNVQAFIAVTIVGALVLGALAGEDIGALKDIALVVVGFYFGTRRRQSDLDPEVAARTTDVVATNISSQQSSA